MDHREDADFAARAEVARRAGEADSALEIARNGLADAPRHVGGRVAASLALLDLGRVAEARAMLEAVVRTPDVASAAPLADLAEAELEEAFETATPESEQMVDAEGIAMQAVNAVEQGEPGKGPEFPSDSFRTATMAGLLERQGDRQGARAIRETLVDGEDRQDRGVVAAPEPVATPVPNSKKRRIKKLERWLQNLGRSGA